VNRHGTDSIPPIPTYPDVGAAGDFLSQFASSLAVGPEEALGMLGDRLLSYEPLAPHPQSGLGVARGLDPAERAQSEA
jgi:hypothetical protein